VQRLTGASVVLLAALLLAGGAVRAADLRIESSREHSQQGDAYYKLEKYANAITEYEQGYLAKSDPSFLYNIAQCHRLMGESAEAIKFYRRFLKDAPNAPNRAIAEKHIKDLEGAAAQKSAPPPVAAAPATPAPPAAPASPAMVVTSAPAAPAPAALVLSSPPPAPPPLAAGSINENVPPPSVARSHPFYTRWWFWTAVGAVVVGGVVVAVAVKHDPGCPGGYTCN
jgi:tetratricopeptide (TPR) repeat protein